MDSQLRKGLVEYCILAAISREDCYGYKLIEDVSPFMEISESTLYPILRRIETAGKVKSYNTEHNNRIRKYFSITDTGKQALQDFEKDKHEIIRVLDYITGGSIDE